MKQLYALIELRQVRGGDESQRKCLLADANYFHIDMELLVWMRDLSIFFTRSVRYSDIFGTTR